MSHVQWALALLAFGACLAACEDERLAPVAGEPSGEGGTAGTSASTSVSSTVASTTSSGAGTPFREVFLRNPFGEQEGNLLADGGFELSIVNSPGQHGWTSFGPAEIEGETGGLCRGGLRCARAPRGAVLFARGTSAPAGARLYAEIWVKPEKPEEGASCEGIDLYVLSCESFTVRRKLSVPAAPDANGWCSVGGSVGGSVIATCMYVENVGNVGFLLDDASLRADVGVPRSIRPAAIPDDAAIEVSPKTRASMDALRDHLRRTLPLGSPPALPPGVKRSGGASAWGD